MCEVELLAYLVVLGYIPSSFFSYILSHDVSLSHYFMPDMFSRGFPWEVVSAEPHLPLEVSLLLEPGQTKSFALPWILVRGEFQIVNFGILFTCLEHILKSIQGRSQQDVIVGVSKDSDVVLVDPAPRSSLFQKLEQSRAVAAVKDGTLFGYFTT